MEKLLFNIDAEAAVLGSILIDPDAALKIIHLLVAADFYRMNHRAIYQSIKNLIDKKTPVDQITLCDQLDRDGELENIGGPAAIMDLIARTPTAMYADHYAGIVKDFAIRRNLIVMAGRMSNLAYDAETVDEALATSHKLMADIGNRHGESTEIVEYVDNAVRRIEEIQRGDVIPGILSGLTFFDRLLGGFRAGRLYTIAARPGMGKSALALNIMTRAAQKGKKVLFYSLEMSGDDVAMRTLSTATRIDSRRLDGNGAKLTDDEWSILLSAANEIAALPIVIDDEPNVTISNMRMRALRMIADGGLDMVIIDYIQLMKGSSGGGNRQQDISDISRGLKLLSRELGIPVIALAQLNRGVESREDKRPMLSDLRESGAIEQDSDAVIFIYREDYYDEDTGRKNIADLLVAKSRQGLTGTASVYWSGAWMEFSDLKIQRTDLN